MKYPTACYCLLLAAFAVLTAPAQAQQDPQKSAELVLMAEGFAHPVALAEPPDDSGRLFIVDQTGQIHILMPDGTLLDEPFLDLQDRMVELNPAYDERGLLGLAFHPDYADNGRFFVYYSAPLRTGAPGGWDNTSHISEFGIDADDANRADPDSETLLLQVDQPQANHAGGTVAFGPDGYLYISLGDGGGANDTPLGHVEDWYTTNGGGNGQNTTENLLGSILRIDVDSQSGDLPYGIPSDNPFGDEQYAYGFRNPFRLSFDMGGSNQLFAGDAGQELWEEVSIVEPGGNYGWNVKEGTHCFDAANPDNALASCPDAVASGPRAGDPLIDPIIEFLNAKQEGGDGLVVVGGHVYRGSALPDWDGDYIFGAWSRGQEETAEGEINLPGRIFVAEPAEEGLWPFSELRITNMPNDSLAHFVLSFGQDLEGEVYVLTTDEVGPTGTTGALYLIGPSDVGIATEPGGDVPETFALEQNFPNPFNPSTSIRYHLNEEARVTLDVYDVLGREVATLVDEVKAPGSYTVTWNGTDRTGKAVVSGIYMYRLTAGTSVETRAMTLLK